MLKPPFTVLILKNSRQPVTVRITTGMVVLFVGLIALAGIVSGGVFSYMLFGQNKPAGISIKSRDRGSFVEIAASDHPRQTSADGVTIGGLEVIQTRDEPSGISILLENNTRPDEMYVWMIVNDEAAHTTERLVIPRNPLLGELPVDYRNGIQCIPGQLRILGEFEEPPPITISSIRVLVYSSDGDILTDMRYKGTGAAQM